MPYVSPLLTEMQVRELQKTCDGNLMGFHVRCLGWSIYHQGRAEGDRAAHVGWLPCREGNEEKKKRRSGSEVKMELKCAHRT